VEECGRDRRAIDDSITGRMRLASWITKAIDPRLGYKILIVFPQKQCLRESTSISRYSAMPNLFTFSVLIHLKTVHVLQTEYCQMVINE